MSDKCKQLDNDLCEANCMLSQTSEYLVNAERRLNDQIKLYELLRGRVEVAGLKLDLQQIKLDPLDNQPYGDNSG